MQKAYSQAEQLLVARANRILKSAMQRAAGASAFGDEMENAVEFALKKVHSVMGEDTDKLGLSGLSEDKVREVIEAAEYITESKRLTIKGLQEQAKNQMEGFYHRDLSEISQKEQEFFMKTRDSGLFQKMIEIGLNYEQVRGIAEEFGSELSTKELWTAIDDYVNNKDNSRESEGELYDYIQARYPDKLKK